MLDCAPSCDAARKAHKVDFRVLYRARRELRGHVYDLDHILGHTGTGKCKGEALSGEGCLWGWLKEDSVAGDDGRKDGVDRDKIWEAVEKEEKIGKGEDIQWEGGLTSKEQ